MKQLWQYIRRNNLQDPSNKRKIICDDALRAVFEIDCTDMFKMNKLLSKHIIRLEPPSMYCGMIFSKSFWFTIAFSVTLPSVFCLTEQEEPSQAKKVKVELVDSGLPTGNGEPRPILVMSEALSHFFGTEEREVLKAEVLKGIWEYIRVNKLEVSHTSILFLRSLFK